MEFGFLNTMSVVYGLEDEVDYLITKDPMTKKKFGRFVKHMIR